MIATYPMTDHATTDDAMRWFRNVPQDWFDAESGDVEAPTGWIGLLVVNEDFLASLADEPDYDPTGEPEMGTYLVVIDDNGLVWASRAETDWATRRNYQALEHRYELWVDEEDTDD